MIHPPFTFARRHRKIADYVAEQAVLVQNWTKAQEDLVEEGIALEAKHMKEKTEMRKKRDKQTNDSERIRKSLEVFKFTLTRKHAETKALFNVSSGKREKELYNAMSGCFLKIEEIDALLEARHLKRPSRLLAALADMMQQLSGPVNKILVQRRTQASVQPAYDFTSRSRTSQGKSVFQMSSPRSVSEVPLSLCHTLLIVIVEFVVDWQPLRTNFF